MIEVMLALLGVLLGFGVGAFVYRVRSTARFDDLRGEIVGPAGDAARRKTMERIGRVR